MPGYYDFVLGLIPLTLAGLAAVLTGAGFELTTAVPLASVAAVGLIGHAMFVRAPVASSSDEDEQTSGAERFQPAD